MCLQYILIKYSPPIFLPHPLSLLHRTISTGFIFLFSYMNTKYIHCILPPSFPYALLERTYFTFFPSFLKCILTVQGDFALVFQTCIYRAFRVITYSKITYFMALIPYYSTAYSGVHYAIFIHRCSVSILFTL
jgi:hypothetical protein